MDAGKEEAVKRTAQRLAQELFARTEVRNGKRVVVKPKKTQSSDKTR